MLLLGIGTIGTVRTACVVNVPAYPSVAYEKVQHCNEGSQEHHREADPAQGDKTIILHTDSNRDTSNPAAAKSVSS